MNRRNHGLVRRGESYYFRLAVPQRYRKILCRTELMYALGTSDIRVARASVRIILNDIERLFGMLRGMSQLPRQVLDAMILDYFRKHKERNVDNLRLPPFTEKATRSDYIREAEADYHRTQEQNLTMSMTPHERKLVVDAFSLSGLPAPELNSPDFIYMVNGLREASEELSRLQLCRLQGATLQQLEPQGRFTRQPTAVPVPTQMQQTTVLATSELYKLDALVDSFLESRRTKKGVKDKTIRGYRAKLGMFQQYMQERSGTESVTLDMVTPDAVTDYQNALDELPKGIGQKRMYSGKTFTELRDMNAGKERLHSRSSGNYLRLVNDLMNHAKAKKLITVNPYDASVIKENRHKDDSENYRSFSADELRTLFGSAAHNDKSTYDTGEWWIPMVGLYSGARLAELVMLRTEDVVTVNGVDCLRVTSTSQRDLKNKWSKRDIPIHPKLIELGFMTFVERKRKRGKTMLFDEVVVRAQDPSDSFGKRFGRKLDDIGLVDPLLVFHSFRHTFVGALRAAGVTREFSMPMTGHMKSDVHDAYGERHPPQVLAPKLAVLDYGIDWESLLIPQAYTKVRAKPGRKPTKK